MSETPEDTPVDLPWETNEPAAERWTDRAFELFEAGTLTAEITERQKIRNVTSRGECPRCGHDVRFAFVLTAPTKSGKNRKLLAGTSDASEMDDVDLVCRCIGVHPGRPDGTSEGCGIIFTARLEVIRLG